MLPSFLQTLLDFLVTFHSALYLQAQGGGNGTVAIIIGYSGMLISIIGNITQYKMMRARDASDLHNSTVTSYKEAHTAQGLVLDSEKTLKAKCLADLEKLGAEHETVLGINASVWMDYAKEGFHIDNKRLQKEVTELKHRLSRYEDVQ
jgi:hypothetical protein